jgi:uncharacterized protein YpuA (DUF1002 family)
MNKSFMMVALAVTTLGLAACDEQKTKTESTQKSETSSGTAIEKQTTTETKKDSDGNVNREVKTETTVDPKGLMNKETTTQESTDSQKTN